MRNGEIEISDAGGGDIDIVFCRDGYYSSHTVSWAEAEILAEILVGMANKFKPQALAHQKCDAINAANDYERKLMKKASTDKNSPA